MLNGLDLFSGYGGLSIALSQYVRPLAFCERDPYAQGILLSRMVDGGLPNAPIWDDVSTFDGSPWRGCVDIITAGFPCQDISSSGNVEGLGGKRSSLFHEVVRLAREIQPVLVFLENVPNIRTKGLDRVIEEFTNQRYDTRWCVISASQVGAIHKRKRWFMLAHHKSVGWKEGLELQEQAWKPDSPFGFGWSPEPNICRVDDGTPHRVDRVKALGNGVVPLQAKEAFERLIGLTRDVRVRL